MLILLLMLFGLGFQATPPTTAPEVVTETWENGKPKSSHEVVRSAEGVAVLHGKCTTYHKNGQLESEGEYAQGKRTGKWMFRWPNGKKQEYGSFEQDKRVGAWMRHDEKGWLCEEGKYVDGARDGPWKFYVDSKKTLDPLRSGEYTHSRFPVGASGVTWEGRSFNGLKTGTWIARRADGTTMFVGDYTEGSPRGPWSFFHADGSFDPEFLSTLIDEKGARLPLKEAPEAHKLLASTSMQAARAPLPDPRLDAWLAAADSTRSELRRALLAAPLDTFGAATARLLVLDPADERQSATALRILDELIAPILGARVEWSSHSLEARRKLCKRLYALYEVAGTQELPDPCAFDPALHWIEVPLDETPFAHPPDIGGFDEGRYGGRAGGSRNSQRSGSADTEAALDSALTWIAAQQSADGSWSPEQHAGDERTRVGVTSQCLMALIGGGSSLRAGAQSAQVRSGIGWLVLRQDPSSGFFDAGAAPELYQHVLALQALSEAALHTPVPVLRQALDRGLHALAKRRLEDGSWPHCEQDTLGDAITTAHCLQALALVRQAGAEVDAAWIAAASSWLAVRVDPGTGLVRTQKGGHGRQLAPDGEAVASAMTLLARYFNGQHADSQTAKDALVRLLGPVAANPNDVGAEMWNWGSYALYQAGGPAWTSWDKAMKLRVTAGQEREGPLAGSWTPTPLDGAAGGRLYATALRALCLEVYFRFLRVRIKS